MATNIEIKELIDQQITNQSLPNLTTHENVGNRMKSIVDYVDQEKESTFLAAKEYTDEIAENTLTAANEAIEEAIENLTPPYKVYTAILSQLGTDNPVATVFQNTLGGNIVWTRSVAGIYEGTLPGVFTNNKVFFIFTPINVNIDYSAFSTSQDVVQIKTWNSGTGELADSLLNEASLEIRIYP